MKSDESASAAKERLRRQMREKMPRHQPEEAAASAQIIARLKEQSIWRNSRSVLFYSSIAGEPDLQQLCSEAIAQRKIILFPRHDEATDSYSAFCVKDPATELTPGRFGIAEPCLGCAEFPLNKLDLVLIPGIAFALNGARLGRGKGYFDRLLAQATGTRCGVAFDWQVFSELPTEAHDILMDCLVTPSQWRVFRDVVDK